MFTDTSFKKYTISEKEKLVGKLEINNELLISSKFLFPFVRENTSKMVIKIGDRNYEKLNNYIITSMKDYYNRLMNSESNSERKMMLTTYNHLYDMWKELYNLKKSNNIVEMDKAYDLFSYELYVLGYAE